MVENYKKMWK